MSTAELLPTDHTRGRTWSRRVSGATGAVFVILTIAGNSLTESVIEPSVEPGPAKALEDFAVKAASGTAQVGLALELLGFVALTVFIGVLLDTLRRKHALGLAGIVAAVAAVIMLAVKLASAAPYLAGLAYHPVLTPDTALALSLTNGAGFVLCWLPFAVFVTAAALALHNAGMLGRLGTAAGLLIGGLGIVAALVGVVNMASATPVPFLLGCLWTLAASIKTAATVQN
jgi:hypothetical protein